jgi:hypothetical protein
MHTANLRLMKLHIMPTEIPFTLQITIPNSKPLTYIDCNVIYTFMMHHANVKKVGNYAINYIVP